jgi:hypothetical protein
MSASGIVASRRPTIAASLCCGVRGTAEEDTVKRQIATAALLAVALGPVACQREEGALEKAGKKIDETVDEITHPNEGPLEKTGRKVDEAVEDAKEDMEK